MQVEKSTKRKEKKSTKRKEKKRKELMRTILY